MITILTEPSSKWSYKWMRIIKTLFKKHLLKKEILPYSGHFAVARSLIEGLKKLDEPFVYNPKNVLQISDHVHVLAGKKTLKYAMTLRKKGVIRRLTAGPNVFIDAFESNSLIKSKEIETYLCPAEWVIDFLASQAYECKNKLVVWAAGVDEIYWKPLEQQAKSDNKKCIIYLKNKNRQELANTIEQICVEEGYTTISVIYGHYNEEEYLKSLQKSDFLVFIGYTESQCLAQFEAWSVNVPVLSLLQNEHEHKGKIYRSSSSPYLNEHNGIFFRDVDQFKAILLEKQFLKIAPRDWIMSNYTDQKCAKNFLARVVGNQVSN